MTGAKKGNRPGRGGITRGPGAAHLNYTNDTELGDLAKAEKLPPGRVRPDQWQTLGVSRASPTADPQRDTTGGAGGAVDGGGEAAWRRRVAPHHREVVRRFFSPEQSERR